MQTWRINGRTMNHFQLMLYKAGKKEPKVVEPTEEEKLDKQIIDMPSIQEVKNFQEEELGEAETPKVIKPFCEFCDSRGVRHKKECPTLVK